MFQKTGQIPCPLMPCLLVSCSSTHYNDIMMGAMPSQITSLTIVFSTVYLDTDQRKHQSSTSLAFVRGIHQKPVNSPHKWPVTRKCFHLMTSSWDTLFCLFGFLLFVFCFCFCFVLFFSAWTGRCIPIGRISYNVLSQYWQIIEMHIHVCIFPKNRFRTTMFNDQ